jgi:hypothetical protein
MPVLAVIITLYYFLYQPVLAPLKLIILLCDTNMESRMDYRQIVTNYGLPAEDIDGVRCAALFTSLVSLRNKDCHSTDEIILVILGSILAYSSFGVSRLSQQSALERYRRGINGKLAAFCRAMGHPVVDFGSVYRRRVYYFDREQLRFIGQFYPELARCLGAISGIDADAALCLREVVGRDLTGLIIEFVMAIRNGQQRPAAGGTQDTVNRA